MRGMIGGLLTGGLVSVVGLSTASLVSEQPAGTMPPEAPLVEAPVVEAVEPSTDDTPDTAVSSDTPTAAPSSPVGSVSIEEPQAPELPDADGTVNEPSAPEASSPEAAAPRADTDPLDEPEVATIEGSLQAPEASEGASFAVDPVEPVLPNPQAMAPQTPIPEADLTVSTAPAQPVVVAETEVAPEADAAMEAKDPDEETFVVDLSALGPNDTTTPDVDPVPDTSMPETSETETETDETSPEDSETAMDTTAPAEPPEEDIPTTLTPDAEAPETEDIATPRLQLQGGENSLLADRGTGVTIRRPATEETATETASETAPAVDSTNVNALVDFAASTVDVGTRPTMSIVLIDDGSMSAAAAALSGLTFPVTIAIDPAKENAADLMAAYRESGFEVAVLAKLPEGALPTDVEVTFQSVFSTVPESVAVLDVGDGGLQSDRDVTEQAMDILASQGRGFVTASQGLNMAGRAADAAGVPSAVIYRELDEDDQDARVIRRFVDQAAFRARQESGVVLVGRVRPDTISALILWGTANNDDQVAVVPLSTVLTAE
ncbi:divergent polysaccharide deacetylase family protein [Octadecabacter sp. 1_MG-2023]|uniref:divergent polysaccharide deacetylase family protein n=1 Tax=unclassified Octadecabacter TaxID=196158 RepID=UPI001C088C37|nr:MULTISPECIES: divergent polysaccharide deacetylase family protein [unclassified Octadecabacter]MBU2993437.1 divergent polysaccharide deacetylase family protein [Octadecabacter sp. B2R22]MDO6733107.1 divergent polysaccharide deacetylase family protein [Octadecabacter sp. 1_MG-2023]